MALVATFLLIYSNIEVVLGRLLFSPAAFIALITCSSIMSCFPVHITVNNQRFDVDLIDKFTGNSLLNVLRNYKRKLILCQP